MTDVSVRRDRWLGEIEEILSELPPLYKDKAISQEAGRRAYLETWHNLHGETSTTIRDKTAKHASLTFDLEVIKMEGEIRFYESRLAILQFLVTNIS